MTGAEDDWRHRAACRDMDPHDFDGYGTPAAWIACETCPTAAQCLAEARKADATGVYQAGRCWADRFNRERRVRVAGVDRRIHRWLAGRTGRHDLEDLIQEAR